MAKNLKTVETDLAALAAPLPTQHVIDHAPKEPHAAATTKASRQKPKAEREVQFSLSLPESARKQLAIKAMEADLTMRGYILAALRDKGIEISEDEIRDARRKEVGDSVI